MRAVCVVVSVNIPVGEAGPTGNYADWWSSLSQPIRGRLGLFPAQTVDPKAVFESVRQSVIWTRVDNTAREGSRICFGDSKVNAGIALVYGIRAIW